MLRKLGVLLALQIATLPPLSAEPFPLNQVFTEAQFFLPKLSPDGSRIAVVLTKNHKQWLTQIDLATMRPEPLAHLDEARLENYFWKGNDFMLMLVSNTDGSRDFRSYNLQTKKVNYLRKMHTASGALLHVLPDDPEHVLVSLAGGDGQDLCRVNVRTGDLEMLEKAPRYVARWIVSRSGQPVAALGNQDKKNFLLWRPAAGAPWQRRELGAESRPDLEVICVHPDQRRLIAWDLTPEGPAHAVALDPSTMTKEVISANERVDPDGVLFWGTDATRPVAIEYEDDRPVRQFLDETAHALQASIDAALPETVNSVRSVSNDGRKMVVYSYSDRSRGAYYLLDRTQGRLSFLGKPYDDFPADQTGPSREFRFSSRDGLPLQGRLTLPVGAAGKPPLVVITGSGFAGPRAGYGFNPVAQAFATRGFAVAQIDYRGTAGYGQAFAKAGDYQITTGMPDDLADGVRWLAKEGLVDENRVALLGVESGGIVAMHALARSKVFAAWINWNTPLWPDYYGYEELAMFPRERSDAIARLGGRRAAAKYRDSIDPKPLVAKIRVPSFHFYTRWPDGTTFAGGGDMPDLLNAAGVPHVFLKQKHQDNRDAAEAEYTAMLGQLLQFLQENVMLPPAPASR